MPTEQQFKELTERVDELERAIVQIAGELSTAFDLMKANADSSKDFADSVKTLADNFNKLMARHSEQL